jgi:hypothetical protein
MNKFFEVVGVIGLGVLLGLMFSYALLGGF